MLNITGGLDRMRIITNTADKTKPRTLRAILVSDFPADVGEQTTRRLLQRGVEVVETMSLRQALRAPYDPELVDIVLVHHEYGGHSDHDNVKIAVEASGLRYQPISRKSSAWPSTLMGSDHAAALEDFEKKILLQKKPVTAEDAEDVVASGGTSMVEALIERARELSEESLAIAKGWEKQAENHRANAEQVEVLLDEAQTALREKDMTILGLSRELSEARAALEAKGTMLAQANADVLRMACEASEPESNISQPKASSKQQSTLDLVRFGRANAAGLAEVAEGSAVFGMLRAADELGLSLAEVLEICKG